MATRFNQKVNLQTQNLASGADSGLMALSGKFQQIAQKNLASREQTIIEDQTLAGQQSFQKGVEPEFKDKDRLIGGVSAKAFNSGLRAAYTVSAKNDALSNINAIEHESGDDLGNFDTLMQSNIAGVMDSIDPSIAPEMSAFLDSQATQSRLRVQTKRQQSDRRLSVETTLKGITDMSDEASRQARNGDLKSSANSLVSTFEAIDAAVAGDMIDESKAAGLKRSAELRATQENIIGLTRGFINDGEGAKALQAVEAIRANPINGMTLDEQDSLMASVLTDVNMTINLKNKQDVIDDKAADDMQEITSQDLYSEILVGDATGQDIIRAISTKSISQSQGSTLLNVINSQGAGSDDWALINDINAAIDSNAPQSEISRVISENTGIRLTQATAGSLMTAMNDSIADGSPLQTEEYKFAIGYMEEIIAPSGLFGRYDETSGKRFAELSREARARVLDGENPLMVVDSLIPKDAILKSQMELQRKYAGVKSRSDMITALDDKNVVSQMDQETYLSAINKINEHFDRVEAFDQLQESVKGLPK